MSEVLPLQVQLRGQTCTLHDVSCFEDRSVGIGWHVEEVTVKLPDGSEIDVETLTEEEWSAINQVVHQAESDQDWPDVPEYDENDLPIG